MSARPKQVLHRLWLFVLLANLLTVPALPVAAQRAQVVPEGATGWIDKSLATANRHMVAAANPLAAEEE